MEKEFHLSPYWFTVRVININLLDTFDALYLKLVPDVHSLELITWQLSNEHYDVFLKFNNKLMWVTVWLMHIELGLYKRKVAWLI